jgi:glycosyltransferase involved in cell wall biosynthesis
MKKPIIPIANRSGRPLRIVHISTTDLGGGAAIAAYRLHQGLRNLGIDSQMLVAQKLSDDYSVHGARTLMQKLWFRVANQIDQIPRKWLHTSNSSLISPAWIPERTIQSALALEPDIVNIHWSANGFLRPESLRRLAQIPTVWTLHDMWAFCGGEHYTNGDERYIHGYLANNRPPDERGFDLNRWVWWRKMRFVPLLQRLTVVTDSQWLGDCARESKMLRDCHIIPINYGLDTELYKPIPKSVARHILNIPVNSNVIVFGAINATTDTRKGIDLLARALQNLSERQSNDVLTTQCIVFGASEPRSPQNFGFPTKYLGSLSDGIALAVVYAAADVMVVPSREEAFGQTALEALSCGTPVVAFNIGGLPDMIDHYMNGYLAQPFDTNDLATGIQWVLEDRERWQELSVRARQTVEQGFTLEHQARRYSDVYSQLLSYATN